MKIYNQNIWGNFSAEYCIANRNRSLADLIERNNPDVCAFQECNPRTSRTVDGGIAALLAPRYAEAYPEGAATNFTPVFYNRDRLICRDSGRELFEGRNDKNSKSFTWAYLEEIATGKRFIMVSFHFWWKHVDEEDELQRLENAKRICAFFDEITKKYPVPLFASGDMNNGINAHQGYRTYLKMLELGMRDLRHLAQKSTDLFTAHDYPYLNEQGEYVGAGMPYKNLDYILCFGHPAVRVPTFSILTEPDALNVSDHCPLVAEIEWA